MIEYTHGNGAFYQALPVRENDDPPAGECITHTVFGDGGTRPGYVAAGAAPGAYDASGACIGFAASITDAIRLVAERDVADWQTCKDCGAGPGKRCYDQCSTWQH